MAKEQDVIQLLKRFDYTDLESMCVALARNFDEIENRLGSLQLNMKSISGGSVGSIVDTVLLIKANATNALADAAAAQETADGQIQGFFQTTAPTEGMNFGDIWIDTDGHTPPTVDDIYRYENLQHGSGGVYDWRATPTNAIGKIYLSAYLAQETANSKITTYYQAAAPTTNLVVGDLWVDTDGNNALYRWNGSIWEDARDTSSSGVGMGVDENCINLWHLDGSLNSHKGIPALTDGVFGTGIFGQALNVATGKYLKAPTTNMLPALGTINFRAKNLSASANNTVLIDVPKSDNTQGLLAGIAGDGRLYVQDLPDIFGYTETTQADFTTGTLTNVVATSAGNLELGVTTSKALNFDGTDDYVQVENSTAISPSQAITVEAWILADTVTKQYMTAIDKPFTSATTPFFDYQLSFSNDGKLRFKMSLVEAKDSDVFAPGVWYHIAGAYDKTNLRLYVNGILKATTPYTENINASGMPLIIGKTLNYSDREWDGEIGDVRIWNVARTQQQIQDNMSRELVGNEAGLVGYWKEGSSAVANDSTTNNNDGTIYGATWGIAQKVYQNFANGKTYSADSYEGADKTPPMAFDGNGTTRWLSGGGAYPHWVQVSLDSGVTQVAKKLRIKPHALNGYCRLKNFKLQGSNDLSVWADIYTGLVSNSETLQEFILSNSVGYRYHRIYGIDSYDTSLPNYMSIWEIEILMAVPQYMYSSPGNREKVIDISSVGATNEGSSMSWSKTTPTNTSIVIETALSTDGGATYGAYSVATSGSAIPSITNATNLSNARLKIKETLATSDSTVTSKLNDLTVSITKRQSVTIYAPNKSTLTTWDSIALTWKSDRLSLVINGTEYAIENPGLPNTFGTYAFIGCGRAGDKQINTLVDELRIDKVYKDVATLNGWHTAGSPFYTSEEMKQWPGYVKADTEGIKVYDSEGNLRAVLGSWLVDLLREYGIKIIKGKIYSTLIRSGEEGATTYVELNPTGNFRIVRNGVTILETMTDVTQGGSMYFSRNNGDAFGLLSYYADLYPGFAFEGKTGASAGPISMRGTIIRLVSTSGVDCYGNLFVNGNMSCTGSKPATQVTENYGLRYMYATESPELVYYDRGRAQLKNGEAIVYLDPIFLETIEPDTELTPWTFQVESYGENDAYAYEWGENYFKVRERNNGTSNSKFGWWIHAIRNGYAGIRLMEVVD